MSNHAWCKDTARDAAVRAAEDGRDRPLPTLGECIERQKQSQTARPCGGTDTASLGGEPSGAVNGMRTERVTLEVEIERGSPPSEWPWSYILSRSDALKLRPGESVRVVEEPHSDYLAQVAMQRDAAIRERDELRKSWLRSEESGTRLLAERNAALDAADGVRKQVAELKDKSHARWVSMNKYLCELSETRCERDEVKARVAELEAASGGGEGEADAWGIVRDGNVESVTHRRFRGEAECCAARLVGTVVPLYRSPPPPRGWLTGEEREAVETARDHFDNDDLGDSECVFIARMMKQILARSTPPEVVLDAFPTDETGEFFSRRDVIAALAAAGVAVKLPPGPEGG